MPIKEKIWRATKWVLLVAWLLCFSNAPSQNLVINGNMEDIRKMPLPKNMAIDGIALEFEEDSSYYQPLIGAQHPLALVAAPGWQYTHNDSANFSAFCSSRGYGRSGKNFNTILVYRGSSVGKDATVKNVAASLCRPLIQGKDYLVSFYIKPFSGTAFTSNVGVAFSDKQIPVQLQFPQEVPLQKKKSNGTSKRQLDLEPAYQLPSILEDTSAYTLMQFVYTAKGGEIYIYIGNLFFETKEFWEKGRWKQSRHFGYEGHKSQYFICYYALDDLEVVPLDKNETPCGTVVSKVAPEAMPDTVLISSIFYKTDSAKAQNDYTALAEHINAAPNNYSVLIVGHTDKEGSTAYNLALSLKRAETLKLHLPNVTKDIITQGEGAKFSVAEPSNQHQNRRVDVYLIKNKDPN